MTAAFLLGSLSAILSVTAGVLLTFVFLPSRKPDVPGLLLLRLFAGGGLGIGVTSCLYFVCLLAGLSRYSPAFDLLLCLILGGICLVLSRRGAAKEASPSLETEKLSPFQVFLAAIFSLELLASLASFVFAFLKEPHGRWDAWLIWNMHARFLYRSGERWPEIFSAGGMDWSHWDYPLLLPLAIVRSWRYAGQESIAVPIAFAMLFSLLTIGLLLGALSYLRGRTQGFLGAMILLGAPFFIVMGASQFTDVPLAFFILATLVLLTLHARFPEERPGTLVLAGLAAGLCAWTKNEGMLFFLIVTGSLFCTAFYAEGVRSALNRTAGFLAGALPILLIVICFKIRLAPANELTAGFGLAAAMARLTDWSRYAEIARAFFITGLSFTQGLIDVRVGMRINPGAVSILLLIAYLFLAGVRIDGRDRLGLIRSAAILALMPTGYFFVYVLSPLNLDYHLVTSLNRLFLQLWPGVIFLCFMIAGAPERAASTGDISGAASKPSKTRPAKGNKPKRIREPK